MSSMSKMCWREERPGLGSTAWREPGSDAVDRWLVSGIGALSRLVASALARRARVGDRDLHERDVGLAALYRDLEAPLGVQVVPAVKSRVLCQMPVLCVRPPWSSSPVATICTTG